MEIRFSTFTIHTLLLFGCLFKKYVYMDGYVWRSEVNFRFLSQFLSTFDFEMGCVIGLEDSLWGETVGLEVLRDPVSPSPMHIIDK